MSVVGRVVQGAGPQAVPALAVTAVAVADEEVAARFFLQEIAEVLRTHRGFEGLHGGAHVLQRFAGEGGLGLVVHGRRVVAVEAEFGLQLEACRQTLGQLPHAALDQVQHLDREGAHRTLQHHLFGNHVGGFASVNHGHADDPGVDGPLVAVDDGLEGLHQLAGGRHGVQALVRHGPVRALALEHDLELVAAGEHRPGGQGHGAGRHARPVVRTEDGVHGAALEQAVPDHFPRAAAAFLGGLEDQVDRALEIAIPRQVPGCGQQHGGVAVVAAGVHLAGVHAGVREVVVLGSCKTCTSAKRGRCCKRA